MEAIVMAAGKGTRMRPLTLTTPKPLLPLQGQPLLHWTLTALRQIADRVLVVAHYLGDQVTAYMQAQTLFDDYAVVQQQPEPLGTGHALTCCQPYLHGESFLVLNGDDLYSLTALRALAGVPAGVLAVWKDDPTRYGVLVRRDDGTLARIHEKPAAGVYTPPVLINTGAYKLNRAVFEHIPVLSERGEYEITDAIAFMANRGGMQVVEADFWMPIGYPQDLERAQALDMQAILRG